MEEQSFETQEWKDYIDFMHIVKNVTNDVIKIGTGSHRIFDKDTETKINKLLDLNNSYLEKLEKKIFEIAIVGAEKTGKSTFVNALIDNLILPARTARCTFTSTQLEYGEDEDAVVEFYSIDEFNEIFRNLLKLLNFANYDRISFDALELGQFEEHMRSLDSEALQRQHHAGKAEEDIKDILSGKDAIKFYLGRGSLMISKEQLADKEYWGKFITDNHISRSVKKIRIRSAKLKSMRSAIIFDVPGFDSPTEIHRAQTLEKVKSADAVILLTNIATNPSIRGPELNILAQSYEFDGTAIMDKLFIFGNQIDRVNNKEDIKTNRKILVNDVKNKLAKADRIFTGSAQAYLVKNKIDTQNLKALEDFNKYEIESFGIAEIRDGLEKYYETERFDVLKKRINRNISKIKEAFDKLVAEQMAQADTNKYDVMDHSLFINFVDTVTDKIAKNLNELKKELKEKIEKEKYFTLNLTTQIEGIFNKTNIDTITNTHERTDETRKGKFNAETVNKALRDEIYTSFENSFKKVITDLADQKNNEIQEGILEAFMAAISNGSSIKKGDPKYEEIKKNARDVFLVDIIADNAYERKIFIPLIERFSGCLFDVVIKSPLGSSERFAHFLAHKPTFFSLAIFDNLEEAPFPIFASKLVNIVLSHKSFKSRTFTEWVKESVLGFKIVEQNYFDSLCKDNVIRPVTAEEVLEEINTDITNLIETFKNSVIKAIDLEQPFMATMTRQIKAIIDATQRNNLKRPLYADFLADHANDLCPEFKKIQVDKAIADNRKNIVAKLQEITGKMNIHKFALENEKA